MCSKHIMVSNKCYWKDCCKMIPGPLSMLLLVICNSVKMGIHLCYKWVKPKLMVKVEKYRDIVKYGPDYRYIASGN